MGGNCSDPSVSGQYSGLVDELQVYSRELSPADIALMANP